MPLPDLLNWELTRDNLHRSTKLLNAVRLRYLEPMPNHLHHSLVITPNGLSTGVFSTGGGAANSEVQLDFKTASVNDVALNGHSLKTLSAQVLVNAGLDVPMTNLSDDTPFEVNVGLAKDYAQTLYSVFTAVARFRARLLGAMSPVVVWSHHFDVSFLWFATAQADETAPHMNFGFSPGDAGIPRPYFYVYAYPSPESLTQLILPTPVRWHTEGWTGACIDYDDVRQSDSFEADIEALLMRIFDIVSPLLS
jgi:hypothetical protein